MSDLIRIFSERGDLAHLALLLWASAASAAAWFAQRELAAASRRFDDFVRELERFNRRADDAPQPPYGSSGSRLAREARAPCRRCACKPDHQV